MNQPLSFDVPRETLKRLEIYADLLKRWNPRINLVSKSSLADIWQRHILDSAQIQKLAPHPVYHWADLGSGAGFPGLVNAILSMEHKSPCHMTLIESDVRKSAFLRTVIRETGAPARVLTSRIENTDPLRADVISARALADLTELLSYTHRHLARDGTALFLKGRNWEKEIATARSKWNFEDHVSNSETETGSVILKITGVERV